MLVRHLWRGGPQLRRRAHRRGTVRPTAGGGQYLAAAAVVHHLRLRHAGDAPPAHRRHAGLAGGHRAAGGRLPGPGAVRVRPPDPPGRRPAAQRLPVGLLHPGRHARPARHLRHRLAGDADGAGRPARPDPREPAPPDVPVDVLALPGPHLGRRVHLRLPDGSPAMSERTEHAADLPPPHGAGHHHEDDDGPHGTLASYLTGFVLAAILTAIPFWLVMDGVFASSRTTALVILAFAVVQIVVHLVYFLHMDAKSESGWNMLALIFTLVLVVITLSGSIWIMYHLNSNMMPMSVHDVRNMP
ncbi:cytochrome O ubiquinol oxidase, subunit IV [Bordetella pertussis STO1-CHLA-0006]|nr:cytochrome O ubiquinol oxidase, subunit IV [Bordetella pertussis 2250905]ETH65368.1 cytochrome O ubiquinol oxidase, subunit IV [Bordetella pertussis STO1-CHLA-0006]